MAASATGATSAAMSTRTDNESLPSLFSRLGDDVMQLFDTKMSLLKVELKEEANNYARGGAMIAVGGGFCHRRCALPDRGRNNRDHNEEPSG